MRAPLRDRKAVKGPPPRLTVEALRTFEEISVRSSVGHTFLSVILALCCVFVFRTRAIHPSKLLFLLTLLLPLLSRVQFFIFENSFRKRHELNELDNSPYEWRMNDAFHGGYKEAPNID